MRISSRKLRRIIREAVSDISIGPAQKVALVNEPYDASKLAGVQQSSGQMAFKPRGYWYACGPDWIEFTRREMKSKYYENGYLYEFQFNYSDINRPDPNKVLYISDAEDYGIFKEKYLRPDTFPDWRKIAQDFGGIELCPLPSDYNFWLRTWDVASGCFWNPDVVKNISTLHEPVPLTGVAAELASFSDKKAYAELPQALRDIFEEYADDSYDMKDNPFEDGECVEADVIFNENYDPQKPDDYTIIEAVEEIFERRGFNITLDGSFNDIANDIFDYIRRDVKRSL